MNIKSINSIDSIENQSNRQNTSGHSTPTTPQSPKIEKRASNDNFGGLNGMEKTEIIQKLINVQKQYVKVSHHDDIIVGIHNWNVSCGVITWQSLGVWGIPGSRDYPNWFGPIHQILESKKKILGAQFSDWLDKNRFPFFSFFFDTFVNTAKEELERCHTWWFSKKFLYLFSLAKWKNWLFVGSREPADGGAKEKDKINTVIST